MNKLILLAFVSLSVTACNSPGDSSSSFIDEDVSSSAEDAVNAISAMMDDSQGESYASVGNKPIDQKINELLFPRAYAANCMRPIHQVCENQQKITNFDECSAFRQRVTRTGQITLDFSTVDCSMENVGDTVDRTFDFQISGVRKGEVEVSSLEKEDYRGTAIGGGAQLTKMDEGWHIEIFGKHKVLSRNDEIRMDKSIRTLSPLEVSGGLGRGQRRVNNGQLEVNHNLKEFTAVYTSSDLQWSSSCCHPVSGSLTVEYTGSKAGTGTITFAACGEATIEKDGVAQDVEFSHCE